MFFKWERKIYIFFHFNQGCQMLNIPTWIFPPKKNVGGRITNTTINKSNNNKKMAKNDDNKKWWNNTMNKQWQITITTRHDETTLKTSNGESTPIIIDGDSKGKW